MEIQNCCREAVGSLEHTSESFVFNVVESDSKGYLRVSEDDERYFVFENGDFFPNLGYNLTFNQVDWINPRSNAQQNKFSAMADNGIQYARIWLTQWSIFGSSWNPWKHHNDAAATGLSTFPDDVYSPESEVSLIINHNWNRCALWGWNTYKVPFKLDTEYRVRVRYKEDPDVPLTGPNDALNPYGLVVKTGGWLWGTADSNCYDSNSGTLMAATYDDTVTDDLVDSSWKILESTFTPTSGNYNSNNNLYLALENVTDGRVMIDHIWIEEVLGGDQYGPNIVTKPDMDHHMYFDQRNSYAFDKTLELVEENGIYIRPVLNIADFIFSRMEADGTVGTDYDPINFYGTGRSVTRVRWLQQAWWRYAQARWGYSTNIHSWEMMNEGDPNDSRHYVMADEFGKYMKCSVFDIAANPSTCL